MGFFEKFRKRDQKSSPRPSSESMQSSSEVETSSTTKPMNLTGSVEIVTYGIPFSLNQPTPTTFERRSLPFPIGAQIKEIIGGGTFCVIRSDSDELFFKSTTSTDFQPLLRFLSGTQPTTPGPFFMNGTLNYCHINYKKKIDDFKLDSRNACYELKEVHCGQYFILLRMMNDLLVYLSITNYIALVDHSYVISNYHSETRKLKHIYVGPLSQHTIILKNDDTIDYFECYQRFTKTEEKPLPIKEGHKIVNCACAGRSTFIVVEDPTDHSHHLFVHGDNQFMVQSGLSSMYSFAPLTNTPFSGKRVKDIKCGYFHTCILMEDGSVYTCGYNAYCQLGYSGGDSELQLVKFPTLPLSSESYTYPNNSESSSCFRTKSVLCSSIATLFISEKGFIMVGDPVSSLQRKVSFGPNVMAFNYSFGNDPIETVVGLKPLGSNSVAVGGWHFVIYHKASMSMKHLRYFFKNLCQFAKITDSDAAEHENSQFSDISFSF